jgi:type I site-specific restriction endonuclease
MAPTGAGKSYLGHRIAHEALLKGKRAVFVCDREALIDQTSESADEYGLSAHAIIKADHWRRDSDMPYQIASIQTIMKRGYWPQADVIIIDEAHTQYKGWTEYVTKTDAACIGLSATPFSPGLGKLFTNLINAATMDELTKQGILVPMRPLSCVRPDMKGAATSGGEWTDRAAEERGMGIVGDVVSEWLRHGEGRKTIVFGSTIRHCEELARQFIEAGVMAAVYTTDTSKSERDQLRAEFKKPNSFIRILISVEALAKGFDVKDVGCVVDCRPLRKSLSTAIQMWGRGLRSSEETGKHDCILLDHSGNILRFLADYEAVYYHGLPALNMGEKLDKMVRDKEDIEPKGCLSCGHKPFAKLCMACGYEYEPPALDAPAVAGEMLPVMLGKKKLADDHRHLWEQVCTYARGHSAPDKQAGRAWHLFKDITGNEPPKSWRFDSTPNAEITRNVQNKIRSMHIAFIRGRQGGSTHV